MKRSFFIAIFIFQLALANSQTPTFSLIKINSSVQLRDTNSFSMCWSDSLNFHIMVSGLKSKKPLNISSNISLMFANTRFIANFPSEPNNYDTAIIKMTVQNPHSSQPLQAFFVEIQLDSMDKIYATYDILFTPTPSNGAYLSLIEDSLYVNYFKATYDWYFNGNLILANSNSNFFVPKASGSYQVLVKSNCDTTFSNKLIYYMTNNNEILIINYQTLFYPNPFYDKIYFIENLIPKNSEIEIFDTYGRLVYSADQIENEIDLTFLSSGFYVFKIGQRNGKKQTFSILKSEHY